MAFFKLPGVVFATILAICVLVVGCSGESGPTLVHSFPMPTNLTIKGSINLADVGVSTGLGGISPSLLDYRPFSLSIQDDPAAKSSADEEGRFSFKPISIRDQYVVFAKNGNHPGFILEYMAADSAGLYGDHQIEISIRSTARSYIARCLRDRYGRRIDPNALTAAHIDSTVRAIADVLESHPEKISNTTLDQVAEVKAAYSAMAQSLNSGNSGVIPNNWVLLFYLGGDNNLANYINDNIAEIENAGLPDGTQIVIQADIAVHGMKRMMFREGKLIELASFANLDSSSGMVIADFVAWSRRTFPAANYALIISSHADGWKNSTRADRLRNSLIQDDSAATRGNPVEIAAWLKGANTTFDGFERPLQLLVFDACNMGMIEIAAEFSSCSEYLVMSQAFVPGSGFPYAEIVKEISRLGSGNIKAEKAGEIFCEAYRNKYLDRALPSAVTVSLIKTSEMPAFLILLQNFFTKVTAEIGKLGPVLANLRDSKMVEAEDVAEKYVIQAFESTDYRDLYSLLTHCRNNMPETAIEIDLILQKFSNLVVANYHSLSAFPDAHGLSISLPDRSAWLANYVSTESLLYAYYQFAQNSSWDEILALINQN
jgi:hypothetical protein